DIGRPQNHCAKCDGGTGDRCTTWTYTAPYALPPSCYYYYHFPASQSRPPAPPLEPSSSRGSATTARTTQCQPLCRQ
uniref:Uncharacterized protein n=1 Tax=Aegilops tauschii subsp. strangulata TaxID=200361 RepID=A0A453DRT3_AEGTS